MLAILAPYLDPMNGLKQLAALQQMDTGKQQLGLEERRVDESVRRGDLAEQQFADSQRQFDVNAGFKEQDSLYELAKLAEMQRANQTREGIAQGNLEVNQGGLELRRQKEIELQKLLGGMMGGPAGEPVDPQTSSEISQLLEYIKQNNIQLPQ